MLDFHRFLNRVTSGGKKSTITRNYTRVYLKAFFNVLIGFIQKKSASEIVRNRSLNKNSNVDRILMCLSSVVRDA